MSLIPNPWVIVAFLVALITTNLYTWQASETAERNAMMAQQGKLDLAAAELRGQRAKAARLAEHDLQAGADEARRKTDAENQKRDARLADALKRLQDRPARPQPGPGGLSQVPAGAGPQSGCTGAGLYRDDAEFLVGRADVAERVRAQRDYCYERYDVAREKLKSLGQALPASP